jgi:hypothetical protein
MLTRIVCPNCGHIGAATAASLPRVLICNADTARSSRAADPRGRRASHATNGRPCARPRNGTGRRLILVQARCEALGYRGGGHLHYRRKPEALREREDKLRDDVTCRRGERFLGRPVERPAPPLAWPVVHSAAEPDANGQALGYKLACEIASAILAFVAAVFWFYAFWIARGTFTQTHIVDLDGIFSGQARNNAIAALCAGVAGALQIVTTWFMPVCRAFA